MKMIKTLFQGMKKLQGAEYCALILMAMAIPISWRIALYITAILLTLSVVRICTTRKTGFSALSKYSKVGFIAMASYWLIYVISALYSDQKAEAWSIVGLKLPFLLYALYFLFSDLHHLSKKHLRLVLYFFVLVCCIRFLVRIAIAIIKYSNGVPSSELIDWQFDPLHHNYLAMYVLLGIAFLYYEIGIPKTKEERIAAPWQQIIAAVMLMVYLLISGSRSGLVVLAITLVACISHLIFIRKRRWFGLVIIIALMVGVGVSYLAMPKLYWRIIYSAQEMFAGKVGAGDARTLMLQCGWETLENHRVFGLGCGDYWQPLFDTYKRHGFDEGLEVGYSTHNQYMETLLACGFLGLAVLLFMMLYPIAVCIKRRKGLMIILFTIVYGGCIFFEATFGRQMGLLFISFWYGIITLMEEKEC